jgi:hypothetical protein
MVNLLCQTSPKKTDKAVETTPRDGSALYQRHNQDKKVMRFAFILQN